MKQCMHAIFRTMWKLHRVSALSETVARNISELNLDFASATMHETISRGDTPIGAIACLNMDIFPVCYGLSKNSSSSSFPTYYKSKSLIKYMLIAFHYSCNPIKT